MSAYLGDLTRRERELVEAAASGEVLECSQLPREQLAVSYDPTHTIRGEVLRELLLGRCKMPLDPRGVRLAGARITGTLDFTHISASVGMELRGCSMDRPLLLEHAHLPWLALTGSSVPALGGDGLQVAASLLLDEGFRAASCGELGTVRLLGARIGGVLSLRGAELINEDGPALVGQGLQVSLALLLDEGFRATGRGKRGTVSLTEARVGGELTLRGAELINEDGPALSGQGLQVDSSLFLDEGFRATGRGEYGTVRLVGARIGNQLSLGGAELINEDGPALSGQGLQVDSSLFLDEGFRATGRGEHVTVALAGARIGGALSLEGAELIHEGGFLLNLNDVEAKHIFLPSQLICPQKINGRSRCEATTRQITLSGLVYTIPHGGHWSNWLHLITRHTPGYDPQPYQQLAAVLRAGGHDTDARQVLIAQQQDRRERMKLGGWLTTTVHRLWGALAGYGYRPSRTALALLLVLLAAGGLGIVAGHTPIGAGHYVAMHTPKADNSRSCSLLEQIGVGVDRGLPLGATGIRDRCDFDTASRQGQAITAATWALQALVWALATLVVAGYTGLIRRVM